MSSAGDIFLALLAILFPPIAVWIKAGICSLDSLINILLFVLGYFPGLLHAWYIIWLYPEPPLSGAGDGNIEGESFIAQEQYLIVPPNQRGGGAAMPYDAEAARGGGGGGGGVTYYYVATRPQQQQRSYGTVGTQTGAGEQGASAGQAPPSYQEAVKGDHKIQRT